MDNVRSEAGLSVTIATSQILRSRATIGGNSALSVVIGLPRVEAAPALRPMLGRHFKAVAAPWLIPLLYTSEFLPAVDVLRWQIVGDLFRIAAWPLGFILLASGSGRKFVLVEASAAVMFVVTTALLIPCLGIAAAGLAYATMSASALAIQFYFARRSIGFIPARATIECFLIVATALATTVAATLVSPRAGAAAALLLGPAAGVVTVRRLQDALPQPLANALAFLTRR